MRLSIVFIAAWAGLVAAQTDPAGQCIQTCFAKVGQDNPDSPDIKRCQALADGLQQLLCLCRSAPLVDAFTTCTGETCPEFAAQVNGSVPETRSRRLTLRNRMAESSQTGALDPSAAGPSDIASGVDAGPLNTAGGVDAGPASDTALSGAGSTNTASGAGAAKTDSGVPAPAPTSGGTDAGNGVRSHGAATLNFVLGGAAVLLAGSLLV